jgi:transposase
MTDQQPGCAWPAAWSLPPSPSRSSIPPGTLRVPHDFAKALLERSKTDATPAQTLAVLGARLQPECWTPPPQIYTELQQRLVHRDGLVAARTQFRNQLHALIQQPAVIASVRTRLETLIASLSEEIATVEQEIAAALQQDQA